jgi:hypothetical protein
MRPFYPMFLLNPKTNDAKNVLNAALDMYLPDSFRRIKLVLFFHGNDDYQFWFPRLHVMCDFTPIVDFYILQCIYEWATNVMSLVNACLENNFRKLSNISPQERAALMSLNEPVDFVFRLADKILALVVMPNVCYLRKSIYPLSVTILYVRLVLPENYVFSLVMATFVAFRQRLFRFFHSVLPRNECKWLVAGYQLLWLPLLSLLPNVHMSPILLRPIVASLSCFPKCFSVFVDELLMSWLLNVNVLSLLSLKWWPVFVSSYHLVVALVMLNFNLPLCPRECLVVSSADFSFLYANILFDDAVLSLIRLFVLVRCDMPIRLLVDCVRFVLEIIFFTSLCTIYRLTIGIAMGTICARILANAILVAHDLVARECWVLINFAYFGRYLVDFFVVTRPLRRVR